MESVVVHGKHRTIPPPHGAGNVDESSSVILSFDIEEHYRIEAASKLAISPEQRDYYAGRMEHSTRWLLEMLGEHEIRATFFVVGEIARHRPGLVKSIHRAGHEVASHGWDHRRVLDMTPAAFRKDLRQSKDALEQVTGEEVLGYRAPTFSITRKNAWALDVLVESGMAYDSSIYPVRHDRYGVPAAPRGPFFAGGEENKILELPPATLRILGMKAPMGGGGYFRLFPLWLTEWAMRQATRTSPSAAMLYFHPWEFDPDQARLPLKLISRFRTYVGMRRSAQRLQSLMRRYRFARAMDIASKLSSTNPALPEFSLAADNTVLTKKERPSSLARGAY